MAPGTLVDGRYRLDAEVGHGGMGRVWRAWDTRLDREVAVKTVDLSASTDPSTGPRFQREILATARLNVPSVVTIFDGGVDGHTAFLVMEYLNGHTVAQLVRDSGPLEVPRVLEIALPVATGLVAAHAAGLVHRDIKPANVMITGSSVKLLDFGIAQLAQDIGAGMTATATTIGTADYMSPEQAAGQRVGPPTDLYALGCLITFMITGRAPFAGESAVAIATQQLNATPPRLDERRAGVPGALTELVGRLLSKDPNARPDAAGTVAALAAIQAQPYAPLTLPLATVVQPAATAVLPATASPPLPARQPGRGWIAGTLVAAMAALVLGGVAFALTSRSLASRPASTPSASPSRTPTASTTTKRPTASATPTKSASVTPQKVMLDGALAAVRAALNSIPADDAKSRRVKAQLLKSWDSTSRRIRAGTNPQKQLDNFEKLVDAAADNGLIGPLQAQGIRTALSLVGQLV